MGLFDILTTMCIRGTKVADKQETAKQSQASRRVAEPQAERPSLPLVIPAVQTTHLLMQ